MHILAVLQILALLTVANGAPVVAKKVFGRHLSLALDFGVAFFDRQPLFGSSKTIRGILISILAITVAAPLLSLEPVIGAVVAGAAMAGDLLSSFVKRRLNYRPSSQALGLDQIPESLLPMLACSNALGLTTADIVLGLALFFAGELVLSRLLFRAHLRDEPY